MSRPDTASADDRYQRYADIFESPETEESIERGWRVLHWEFSETWNPRETVTGHARRAERIAQDHAADVTDPAIADSGCRPAEMEAEVGE